MECCCKAQSDSNATARTDKIVAVDEDDPPLVLNVKDDGTVVASAEPPNLPDIKEDAKAEVEADTKDPPAAGDLDGEGAEKEPEKPLQEGPKKRCTVSRPDGTDLEAKDVTEVTVPEGAKPGDRLDFEHPQGGRGKLSAVVPDGLHPGHTFEIVTHPEVPEIQNNVTRLTNHGLLRAVALSQVLTGWCKHLIVYSGGPSQEQSQLLYGLSKPVEHYKEYLSHRRCDKRRKKWITILLYYNSTPASVVGSIVAVVACVLRALEILPAAPVNDSLDAGHIAPWSLGLGYLIFLICLRFWHHLPSAVGGSLGRSVFADTFCINYADADQKATGISNFVAYVSESERVLVLWSKDYFCRLWTTLELASAVLISTGSAHEGCPLKKSSKVPVVFRPINIGVLTMSLSFMMFMSYLVSIGMRMTRLQTGLSANFMQTITFMAIAFIMWPILTHAIQKYLKDRRKLKHDLLDFDANMCEEENEDERKFIFKTIAELFGGVDVFNNFVRFKVHDAIYHSLGSGRTLPSYTYVVGLLPAFWAQLDYGVYYFEFYKDSIERALEYCVNQVAVVAVIFAQFPVLVVVLRQLGFSGQNGKVNLCASIVIGLVHGFAFLVQVGVIISIGEWRGVLWPSCACLVGYIIFSILMISCCSRHKAV